MAILGIPHSVQTSIPNLARFCFKILNPGLEIRQIPHPEKPIGDPLHLGSRFFSRTPPRFGAPNLPEVNQFTGNCFRMVRIVLKITFLKLRYPKVVTGRLPLCPIMALASSYFPDSGHYLLNGFHFYFDLF